MKAKPDFMKKVNIGDLLIIFPVHSCLTANLYQQYLTTEGKILTKFCY
ncbi:MAG: hypothetical protein ACXAC8_06680 [Candidatus Hodarchaeales archaeon]